MYISECLCVCVCVCVCVIVTSIGPNARSNIYVHMYQLGTYIILIKCTCTYMCLGPRLHALLYSVGIVEMV